MIHEWVGNLFNILPEWFCGNGAKLVKVNIDYEQVVNEATSFLIRECAGNLFNAKFGCMKDLTLYLIDKIYMDNRLSAAHTILSSMSKNIGKGTVYSNFYTFNLLKF